MRGKKQREYDYNSKPRDWRRDRTRAIWTNSLLLVIGLGIAGTLVYLAVTK